MTTAQIASALVPLVVPLDSVRPHPRNVRDGDIGAISQSLERFTQVKPIVVQASTRHIIAGNHLWKAAKALGWSEIAANVIDVDDATALALMVADNRTQELGRNEPEALAALLTELAETDNLAATGYDGDDVDALLAELAAPFVPAPGEQVEPRLASDVVVEILCSRDDLVAFQPTLNTWSTRRGVTIDIS